MKGIYKGIEEHIFDIRPKKAYDYTNINNELTKYAGRTHSTKVQKSIKYLKLRIYMIIKAVKYMDYTDI